MEKKQEMQELSPQYLYSLIEKNAGRIEAIERGVKKADRKIQDIEEEWPLLPPEADDLSRLVQQKGVECMGGKKSGAYKNTDLRRRVYQDIYAQVKRQYGLVNEFGRQQSYKKLKRKYLKGALAIVGGYELPITLANEIDAENDLDFLE